jgi:hypothetical protein
LSVKNFLFAYQSFFKIVLPKATNEKANFESIKPNVIDNQIVYQLHDTTDVITFYKRPNLNAYKRHQNEQDYMPQECLKVNIMPNHIVYAYKGHDFNVYLADEFIFIVYATNCKKAEMLGLST